ncbi:MarR family transcriptional regulator [Myxococcota bacterium]|nr:MarR family transcriptional regulator [Myxococcota bacterium]
MARGSSDPIPYAFRSDRSEELAAWPRYRDNLARHLIGLARDLQLRLVTHLVAACDHRDLRPSFGVLISLVARAPRPLSQLARELAISPQAASQLVALAERAGYLARESNPADRRTRWPVLTPAGERLVGDGIASLRAIEAEHASCVGSDDYQRFLAALASLVRSLGLFPQTSDFGDAQRRDAAAQEGDRETGERGRPAQASAGLLPILAAHVEQDLMRATGQRGHAGLKLSHGQILTLIGPSGARLHRLAELHGVSRQAISATAQDLERLHYLRREADPSDRRGVVVRLTTRGRRLIEDSVAALDELERDWHKRIDAPEFEVFERVARRLYGALELETAILCDAFETRRGPVRSDGADTLASEPGDALRHLAQLAARLRHRLGSDGAARLAAHLTADP